MFDTYDTMKEVIQVATATILTLKVINVQLLYLSFKDRIFIFIEIQRKFCIT
jgi:hypothetical protein